MTLKECIAKILEGFTVDDYFDSHTVINELRGNKEYDAVYLGNFGSHTTVENYHSDIAKMIDANNSIKKIGTAKTHTIYGKLSENKLWQKQ